MGCLDFVAPLVDALETIDGATAAGFAVMLIAIYPRSFSLDSCIAFTALAALAWHYSVQVTQRYIDVNDD